LIGNFVGI